MKALVALALPIFCVVPVAGLCQGNSLSLPTFQMPDALIQRADVRQCNATATMPATSVGPLLDCLEQAGNYVTARRVAIQFGTYLSNLSEYVSSNECCGLEAETRASNLLSAIMNTRLNLDKVVTRFENEQHAHPQLPDEVIEHPQSCESDALRAAVTSPDFTNLDFITTDDPLAAFASATISAERLPIAPCHFARKDWHKVIGLLLAESNAPLYGDANVEWHLAIAYDEIGDHHNARAHIRNAFNDLNDPTSPALARQIKYDYNRLGVAKADAVAGAEQERQITAETNAELATLSPDERQVREERGKPCHIAYNDDASTGHWEVWRYDCIGDGDNVVGKEQFTFLNGKLWQHLQL